ncbi:MAG: hypothetical protein EMLJLAPB_00505 [Candidatus Argoarchaeum ethanivorans]|uniref:Uncharacterized protein n=1 Tax=Candidatus Argoarchaeum ethanivorans TaxID=2608793 RepID=A0A811TCJ9_9EURY|nr:MAG: hypothetical protein EMLJLAPB_00505 [Candidatus Argoarchaeum ethanivorans]
MGKSLISLVSLGLRVNRASMAWRILKPHTQIIIMRSDGRGNTSSLFATKILTEGELRVLISEIEKRGRVLIKDKDDILAESSD